MEKFHKCIQSKQVNDSHSRELVYKFLLKEDECLTVQEILNQVKQEYQIKISTNTLYRHLKLFMECGLVISIQND